MNLATTSGRLICVERRFVEFIGPVRHQHAVRCARNRVFRNAFGGCKVHLNRTEIVRLASVKVGYFRSLQKVSDKPTQFWLPQPYAIIIHLC